jgi:hypothetical protein
MVFPLRFNGTIILYPEKRELEDPSMAACAFLAIIFTHMRDTSTVALHEYGYWKTLPTFPVNENEVCPMRSRLC